MSDPWTLATARTLISSPQYSWESIGSPPAVNEGPEILKNPTGKVLLIFLQADAGRMTTVWE